MRGKKKKLLHLHPCSFPSPGGADCQRPLDSQCMCPNCYCLTEEFLLVKFVTVYTDTTVCHKIRQKKAS